jgi:hypothetical protein
MRYRTLLLFVLMFASAVGAAIIPAVYDNMFPVLLFIAFPIFTALMFTSIVYDIMHPRPAQPHARTSAQPAPQAEAKTTSARPVVAAHPRAA